MIGPRCAFGMGLFGQRGGVLFGSGLGGYIVKVLAHYTRVLNVYREERGLTVWRW